MSLLTKAAAEAWGTYLRQRDERCEDAIRCDYGVFQFRNTIYQRTLSLLQGLYLRQYDPDALRSYVRQHRGTTVALRNPANWLLVLRETAAIPQIYARSLASEYLCCDDDLEAVGVLAVRPADDDPHRHTKWAQEVPCVLMMGKHGTVYVYDWETDGLYEVASDLKVFAKNGLLWCEYVYRHPQTPFSTTEPRYHVQKFLCADPTDAVAVAQTAREMSGLNLVIRTPGRTEVEPLLMLGSVEALRACRPFDHMSAAEFRELRVFIRQRLCCEWYVVGMMGYYLAYGPFVPSGVVLLDQFGVVYFLKIEDSDLYRLADNFHMFLKCGLLKTRGLCRFDRGLRGECRLEELPVCHHTLKKNMLRWHGALGTITRAQLESALDWFLRPSRGQDKVPNNNVAWGRTDLLATGALQDHHQSSFFPAQRLETLPALQGGLWEDNDETTQAVEGQRCFRVAKCFPPTPHMPYNECGVELSCQLSSDEDEAPRQPRRVAPRAGNPPHTPYPSDNEEGVEDAPRDEGDTPAPPTEPMPAEEDDETEIPSSQLGREEEGDGEGDDAGGGPPVYQSECLPTTEREAWLHRGRRAKAMHDCGHTLKQVVIPEPDQMSNEMDD
ncbi:tegument protein US22 [Panine betaherpesvirus 2]|uniref:Tegument protein US22 n=1 Tax=Panine betaherpesvirus 2 TaxID=188763 RepID=Q8QRT7_9BETA|nr:tegument protein US22 [Panine betaherpesvirus 2]AAM00801.1 tegument protein US22 [Panine betaherpesvirus 2]